MNMVEVLSRIEKWIEAEKSANRPMSARSLSMKALGSTDTIRNWIRSRDNGNQIGATERSVTAVARAMGVSEVWLRTGEGDPTDEYLPTSEAVPLVSWVSAGQLSDQDGISDLSEYPVVHVADLPCGNWIALRVQGTSMNKISPPDSIIIVDLDDKRLTAGKCYIITDGTGATTYKAYDPKSEAKFVARSYLDHEPPELIGDIRIVGRVYRTMMDL